MTNRLITAKKLIPIMVCIVFAALLTNKFPKVVFNKQLNSAHDNDFFGRMSSIMDRTQIILADDVMVNMRVSKFYAEHGYTGFSLSEVAQPATSYIYPILTSPLFKFLPDSLSLICVVLLSLLFFVMSVLIVTENLKMWHSILVFGIVFLNSTTINYLFSGWEHIVQPFFVVLTFFFSFKINNNLLKQRYYVYIAVFGVLAFLVRQDSIFLVAPVFFWLLLLHKQKEKWITFVLAFILLFIYFIFQFRWFGTLTPTTSRLKAGQLPNFSYQARYLWSTFISGSAALFIPTVIILFRDSLFTKKWSLITFSIIGIMLSFLFLFLVSDVFPNGRMYFTPLIVVIYISLESLRLKEGANFTSKLHAIFFSNKIWMALFLMLLLSLFNCYKVKIRY